jgi:hypothetical protein
MIRTVRIILEYLKKIIVNTIWFLLSLPLLFLVFMILLAIYGVLKPLVLGVLEGVLRIF